LDLLETAVLLFSFSVPQQSFSKHIPATCCAAF
jgi:hypothetical protein